MVKKGLVSRWHTGTAVTVFQFGRLRILQAGGCRKRPFTYQKLLFQSLGQLASSAYEQSVTLEGRGQGEIPGKLVKTVASAF